MKGQEKILKVLSIGLLELLGLVDIYGRGRRFLDDLNILNRGFRMFGHKTILPLLLLGLSIPPLEVMASAPSNEPRDLRDMAHDALLRSNSMSILAPFFRRIEELNRDVPPEDQLYYATFTGDVHTVSFLLEAGIDPNTVYHGSLTLPMIIANRRSELDEIQPGLATKLFELFINAAKFNPNLHDGHNWPLLHIVIQRHYREAINLLLGLPGIDLNIRGRDGNSALHLLAKRADPVDLDFFDRLISSPEIDLAAKNNRGRTASKILASKLKTTFKMHDSIPEIDLVAKNDQGQTKREMLTSKLDTICYMIERMDQVSQQQRAEPSPAEELRDLIIDDDDENAARIENELQNPDLAINWQDRDGRTLLMYAARTYNEKIIKLILDHPGIDLSLKDRDGKTALSYALANRHPRIIALWEGK